MYEMNKLLHGQGACTGFSHSFFLYQKSSERAALARSLARFHQLLRKSRTRALSMKRVISMYIGHDENRTANQIYLLDSNWNIRNEIFRRSSYLSYSLGY